MNRKYIKKVLTLVFGLILVFVFSSCSTNNQIYWFVDANDIFHTDNLELAQKEIPFVLVIPTYIPKVIGNEYYFEIRGPIRDLNSQNIDVVIRYGKDDYEIDIREQNRAIVMNPNPELEPVYFDIEGVQVLRQITAYHTGAGTTEGLSFNWNSDELTFRIEIYNISEEEGLKIVESMIE